MSANAAVDHYEILGVPEHADTQAIEAAYRAGLAKIKASLGGGNPLPSEFLGRLREAYRILIDAELRLAYDEQRHGPAERQPERREPVLDTAPMSASAEVVVVMGTPISPSKPDVESAASSEVQSIQRADGQPYTLEGGAMPIKASKSLKWLYCLTLVSTIFPTALAGALGWVSLVTGRGLLSFGIVSLVVWLLAFAYRILLVVKHPTTLDAYRSTRTVLVLRKFGIFLMIVGLIGALFQLFAGQLAAALFGHSSGNGIALFVVRMYAYAIASGGLVGLCLFELSRLLGFETKLRAAS